MATESSPDDFRQTPSLYDDKYRPRALFSDKSESRAERFCAGAAKLCRGLQTFIFLGTLGALTAVCALAVRTAALFGERVRDSLLTATPTLDVVTSDVVPWNCTVCFHLPQTFGYQFLGWSTYTVGCVAAASVGMLFTWISPQAMGSGIPRMKSALSGIYIHRFLGAMTLAMKLLGMLMVRISGLAVGQEGPFVHVSCCISYIMMRLPFCKRYKSSSQMRVSMLSVGCACGVAATFGSTFGGVIFAIEAVSTYFHVADLARMFYAASVGSLLIRVIPNFSGQDPLELFSTSFSALKLLDNENSSMENSVQVMIFIALCVSLGIICGIIAGAFNQYVAAVMRVRLVLLEDPEKRREARLGTSHRCRRCRRTRLRDDVKRNGVACANFARWRLPLVSSFLFCTVPFCILRDSRSQFDSPPLIIYAID